MYVCMYVWSLLLSGVPSLRPPPPPLPPPFTGITTEKDPSCFCSLSPYFVCYLVCVFKCSLFYDFDLITATLRIYKKIQLSCIFGYCFIAVGRERSAPKRKQLSTRGTQSKKRLSFEYSLRLIWKEFLLNNLCLQSNLISVRSRTERVFISKRVMPLTGGL